MATNPMQRKSRISFLLGMLLMLVISAAVIAFLYMQIQNQQKEIAKYTKSMTDVFVLNQDVKSGQVLTFDMFVKKSVSRETIPQGATTSIGTTLDSYSLCTKDGTPIYYSAGTQTTNEVSSYYYIVGNSNEKYPIYITDNSGKEAYASFLKATDKAYYYESNNKSNRKDIEVSENAVIAKVDLNANTVITTSLITRASEITTDDSRKEEYNVISLPVDLQPDEYVDIRLKLPNGQNYIVVSKKKVTIPVANGAYLADTIQMNLTEEEILLMSAAIVENYRIDGSELYASRYVEAGNQNGATISYIPNDEVWQLLATDKNVVAKAVVGIQENRQRVREQINAANSQYGLDENVKTKTEQSITSTLEQRRNYLQTLVPGV